MNTIHGVAYQGLANPEMDEMDEMDEIDNKYVSDVQQDRQVQSRIVELKLASEQYGRSLFTFDITQYVHSTSMERGYFVLINRVTHLSTKVWMSAC